MVFRSCFIFSWSTCWIYAWHSSIRMNFWRKLIVWRSSTSWTWRSYDRLLLLFELSYQTSVKLLKFVIFDRPRTGMHPTLNLTLSSLITQSYHQNKRQIRYLQVINNSSFGSYLLFFVRWQMGLVEIHRLSLSNH